MKEYQTRDCRKMTPLSDIAPEVLQAIREVLAVGYGEVRVIIKDGKIENVYKTESVKVGR